VTFEWGATGYYMFKSNSMKRGPCEKQRQHIRHSLPGAVAKFGSIGRLGMVLKTALASKSTRSSERIGENTQKLANLVAHSQTFLKSTRERFCGFALLRRLPYPAKLKRKKSFLDFAWAHRI
jgi:hypothetical protein